METDEIMHFSNFYSVSSIEYKHWALINTTCCEVSILEYYVVSNTGSVLLLTHNTAWQPGNTVQLCTMYSTILYMYVIQMQL